jgi:ABC-type branched-subunit amino acid transport system substrate-binding protein
MNRGLITSAAVLGAVVSLITASRPGIAQQAADTLAEAKSLGAQIRSARSAQEKADAEGRAFSFVDDRLPSLQVVELYTTLPKDEPLREFVIYKYARLLLHSGKLPEAYAVLGEYEVSFPTGRFASAARMELDRLASFQKVNTRSIGILLPITGEYKAYGEQIMRAIRLAISGRGADIADPAEEVTEGLYRTSDGISLHLRDTAGNPEKTAKAFEELVTRQNVIAVIGPVFTGPAAAAAGKAVEIGVPIITLSRKEGITDTGPWVFRNCLTNSAQGEGLARLAVERLGLKTFAIMYPNIPYGVELANYFWDAVDRLGGEVVGVEIYDSDQTTFTPQAKKLVGKFYIEARPKGEVTLPKWAEGLSGPRLKKAMEKQKGMVPPQIDFAALFIPDYADKVSLVVPAIAVEDVMFSNATKADLENAQKATGFKDIKTVQLLGGNGWDSPNLPERAGKFVEGSIFVDGFFPGSEGEETRQFVEDFKRVYGGKVPGLLEAHAFDSARMLLDIIRRNAPKNRAGMRQALLSIKDFPGAGGKTSFMPNGEVKKELFVITVEGGTLKEMGRIVP